MRKFKVGDYVQLKKLKKYYFGDGGLEGGEIGVVESVNGNKIGVGFKKYEDIMGKGAVWNGLAKELTPLIMENT